MVEAERLVHCDFLQELTVSTSVGLKKLGRSTPLATYCGGHGVFHTRIGQKLPTKYLFFSSTWPVYFFPNWIHWSLDVELEYLMHAHMLGFLERCYIVELFTGFPLMLPRSYAVHLSYWKCAKLFRVATSPISSRLSVLLELVRWQATWHYCNIAHCYDWDCSDGSEVLFQSAELTMNGCPSGISMIRENTLFVCG